MDKRMAADDRRGKSGDVVGFANELELTIFARECAYLGNEVSICLAAEDLEIL
jgi:hypothetical protein